MQIYQEPEAGVAWDCDPLFVAEVMDYDMDLDEELDETDWQVIVLDRFHDRLVEPRYSEPLVSPLGRY